MNLIEQLQSDVASHLRQLEHQEARLEAELIETRKAIRSAKSYQAKLLKQHPNGEAVLPLADPDEEPEDLPDTGAPPPSDHELTVEEYQASRSNPEPAPTEELTAPPMERTRRRKATAEEVGNG